MAKKVWSTKEQGKKYVRPTQAVQNQRVDQIVRLLVLRAGKHEITAMFLERHQIPRRTTERYITRARKRIKRITNRTTEEVVDEGVAYWVRRRREADERFQFARQKVIEKEAIVEEITDKVLNYPPLAQLSREERSDLAKLYERRDMAMLLLVEYRKDRDSAQSAADDAQKAMTNLMGAAAPFKIAVTDTAGRDVVKLDAQPVTQQDAMDSLKKIQATVLGRHAARTITVNEGPQPPEAKQ